VPKKLLRSDTVPTLVLERLTIWGRTIHAQRTLQRITAADLCARMSISEATLRRMEQGDPGTGVGAFLSALLILGVMEEAAPALATSLWLDPPGRRVRRRGQEKNQDGKQEDVRDGIPTPDGADADYF
jgi:transcriptional regulator with XRE-family HTH domain